MTRYELERHLGKYVEIVLFDGTVIEGILHKTGEKAFENDANLSIPKLRSKSCLNCRRLCVKAL